MQADHGSERLESLMFDLRPKADPEFESRLRSRLLREFVDRSIQPLLATDRPFWPRLRWIALATTLAIALVLMTPPGRTLAQRILRLGVFTITNQPSLAEQKRDEPIPQEEVHRPIFVSAEPSEASELAGFEIYYPAYLPRGYRPVFEPPVRLIVDRHGEISSAEALFSSPDGQALLSFSQHRFPPDEQLSLRDLPVGETAAESVQVGAYPGLWLPEHPWGIRTDESGMDELVRYNVLVWIQPSGNGSNYFWLGSQARLGQEVMLRIARSITAG